VNLIPAGGTYTFHGISCSFPNRLTPQKALQARLHNWQEMPSIAVKFLLSMVSPPPPPPSLPLPPPPSSLPLPEEEIFGHVCSPSLIWCLSGLDGNDNSTPLLHRLDELQDEVKSVTPPQSRLLPHPHKSSSFLSLIPILGIEAERQNAACSPQANVCH
jgi:hypothetical protein